LFCQLVAAPKSPPDVLFQTAVVASTDRGAAKIMAPIIERQTSHA
jgi:hypothetical protein